LGANRIEPLVFQGVIRDKNTNPRLEDSTLCKKDLGKWFSRSYKNSKEELLMERVSTTLGHTTLSFETGRMAKQADGSIVAQYGDTVVIVAVVGAKEPMPGKDFFPLTVEYRERSSAAGRIPGGWFKREGRPRTKEILTSRLIDRPIRPLFPDGFFNEVQMHCTVISSDQENDSDVLAVSAASAALAVSDIPVADKFGCVRIGRVNGDLL
jgi:polyribonucleotide nucleotidyltransferase